MKSWCSTLHSRARRARATIEDVDRWSDFFDVDRASFPSVGDVARASIVDGAGLRRFTHHTGSVYALALLPAVGPDGSLRFASGGDDRTVRIVENGLVIDPADEL